MPPPSRHPPSRKRHQRTLVPPAATPTEHPTPRPPVDPPRPRTPLDHRAEHRHSLATPHDHHLGRAQLRFRHCPHLRRPQLPHRRRDKHLHQSRHPGNRHCALGSDRRTTPACKNACFRSETQLCSNSPGPGRRVPLTSNPQPRGGEPAVPPSTIPTLPRNGRVKNRVVRLVPAPRSTTFESWTNSRLSSTYRPG
jgi:hypothetical protein